MEENLLHTKAAKTAEAFGLNEQQYLEQWGSLIG